MTTKRLAKEIDNLLKTNYNVTLTKRQLDVVIKMMLGIFDILSNPEDPNSI